MILLLALSFIDFISLIQGEQLHDHMTKEEKELVFRINHDEVKTLRYEVVPLVTKCVRLNGSNEIECPGTSSGFERPSIYLETFGENFELFLEENNNILFGDKTPVIKPYIDSDGKIKYDKRFSNLIPILKMGAYHDRSKRAALTIHKDENGRINVNGIINNTIIIRSIPKRLHEEVLSKNRNLSKPLSKVHKTDEAHNHIIIKREIQDNLDIGKNKPTFSQEAEVGYGSLNRKPRGLESKPRGATILPSDLRDFTVYPKLLIVLDHATYLMNHKDIMECIRHTIAYWNVVDLRFREIVKPKIRFHIAGIIVATKPKVTPYMEKRKASATSRYDEKALSDLAKFFAKENVTHIDYDIAVGVSPWRLVAGGTWLTPIINWFTNAKLGDSVHGLAYLRSICKYPLRAVALLRDGGDLFNANVGAHEIGHILGAHHDPENLLENDLDYQSHFNHGYMMSYVRVNKNQMHWSEFSIREMQTYLQAEKHNRCLVRKPTVGTPYRKILPGKFVSRDEQCQVFFGFGSFSVKDSINVIRDCLNSYCYSPANDSYVKVAVAAAEGSFCGVNRICIEGECVKDPTDPTIYQDLSLQFKN